MDKNTVLLSFYEQNCGLTFNEVAELFANNCYDIVKNNCDGSCQGCSDCLIAESIRRYGEKRHISQKEMYDYTIKLHKSTRDLFEDEESYIKMKQMIEEIQKQFGR